MIKVLVYNVYRDEMETYELNENDSMPYVYGNTMQVQEFRGSSNSSIVWTTNSAMEAWNETRRTFNAPIPFNYAFKRIWEGGHGKQSQHYAGVSFDVGQVLNERQRQRIHQIATNLNVWSYVEPLYLTPSWVHFDKRYGQSACSAGYPTLRLNDKGVYVLILQDALNALGFNTLSLDGIFGNNTLLALKTYQQVNNLGNDGIVGCDTWTSICNEVVGIGQTSSVITP